MDQARRPDTDDSHWATKSVGLTIWLRIGMFAPFFSFAFLAAEGFAPDGHFAWLTAVIFAVGVLLVALRSQRHVRVEAIPLLQ